MEPWALFMRGRHATTQLCCVLRILSLFGSIQGAEVPDSMSAGDWLTCPQPKYQLPCCALGVSHEQSGQCFPLGPAASFGRVFVELSPGRNRCHAAACR